MENNYSFKGRTFSPDVQANIDSVERLVRYMAHAYARRARIPTLDEYDLFQEGMIILLDRALEYDSSKGQFRRYVAPHIRGKMMNCIRDQKRFRTMPSEIYGPRSPEQTYAADQREAVLAALNDETMNPSDREVIVKRYMLNQDKTSTFEDMGSEIGRTGMAMKYRERNAIKELRKLCADAA